MPGGTTAERELKMLIAKKEGLFVILQSLYDKSKALRTNTDKINFKILCKSIGTTRNDLMKVLEQINTVGFETDDDFKPDFSVLRVMDEMYCHIQAAVTKIEDEERIQLNNSASSSASGGVVKSLASLPKIEIPEFSGEIRQWETFHSIFKSLIHENNSLSNADKVHYLVGRLKGAALSVCAGLSPTEQNYTIIWDALVSKYEDKRALASSYFNQLVEFKSLPGESTKNLNFFLERFDTAVRALKKIGLNELADFILMSLALSKLDNDTVRLFEMAHRASDIPTYEELITFVKSQSKILGLNSGTAKRDIHTVSNSASNMNFAKSRHNKSFIVSQLESKENRNKVVCNYCHKIGHFVGQCDTFKALVPTKRYDIVKNRNWCFNCLSAAHGVRSCPSKRSCAKCDKKHHILLHLGRTVEQLGSHAEIQSTGMLAKTELTDTEDNNTASCNLQENQLQIVRSIYSDLGSRVNNASTDSGTVLLATAVVDVVNSDVKNNTARFLIDSGSQVHLLTTKCCKKLGLDVSKFHTSVLGLGSHLYPVKGVSELIIASRFFPDKKYIIKVLLVDKISDNLPGTELNIDNFPEIRNVQLADANFEIPGEIDGIIGAELFPFIFGSDKIICTSTPSVVAMETVFGYILMGKYNHNTSLLTFQVFFVESEDLCIEKLVKQFWEIEQVPQKSNVSPEDVACETIFNNTYSRSSTGRFTVALPFEKSPNNLGDSKTMAMLRLFALERKLLRFPGMRLEYNKVMKDFIDQGHMRLVEDDVSTSNFCYYMPHHAVFKPTSSSTPVRVVLDASAACDNNVSLNDLLYCGPKLQADIFTLLLNFRQFKIALTADIRQMYRQINIIKDHFRFQRLLWRFNPDDKISVYEITTVAFGVKSSPYLALRTILQLVNEEKLHFPHAAETVEKCLYMDDYVTSVSSEEEGHRLFQEAIELFKAGGFELTKWSTNSEDLLQKIPIERRLEKDVTFKSDTKILGMKWNPVTDTFRFNLEIPPVGCSRRIILSVVARCFDPVGLIAPFILYLKLLIKELWRLKLGWDETPPDPICKIYSKLRNEWVHLGKVEVCRHVGICSNFPVTLVAFADASCVGFGAVIYVRSVNKNGKVIVKLLCAKSKVSPMKMVTIPRLELCAALLLSKLLKHVLETYSSKVVWSGVWAFTDSTIVLQWLSTYHIKDIFVANRVTQIRENLSNVHWCHVDGDDNPADCLSRGLTPSQLVSCGLWYEGPSWIKKDIVEWPVTNPIIFSDKDHVEEVQETGAVLIASNIINTKTENNELLDLIHRSSSFSRLLRITIRVLKFLRILEKRDITASDLNKAESYLVKIIQVKYFAKEIALLQSQRECSNRLRKLRPFLHEGLLRVGGRLTNADLSFQQCHPIILPSKNYFVELLVDFYHKTNMHAGPFLLEALLRQKYWIVGGRNFIRSRVHKCNHCFRLRPRIQSPLMANLPIQRVQQAKVFCHTGVDYFGPFNLTLVRRKNAATQKAYVCLFICMSVKAIHLELASSLSTSHFLQCFKRFLSRRGPCQVLYSDQGTNFVGAKRVLDEIREFVTSESFKRDLNEELVANGIQWKFNTPSAPHMGGLWESNVKSAKHHLYRVIGKQSLSYEEFNTLLTQVEALLNSRPLCRLGADPTAPEALTPAHFLTLTPLRSFPADNVTDIPVNRLDRYQLIDRMIQDYWKRWHLEYLTTLQVREKWNKRISNIKVGTVVIVKNEASPPLNWPIAVVSQIHSGSDGIVRNVTIKTAKGYLTRPVVKLCPLPTQ